jgi:Bacterial CdiA-CT RNAse A domain
LLWQQYDHPSSTRGYLSSATIASLRLEDMEYEGGGHTVRRHVGKDEAWLRQRLDDEPTIPAASSFKDMSSAHVLIQQVLQRHQHDIEAWLLNDGAPYSLTLRQGFKQDTGIVVPRKTRILTQGRRVTVHLEKKEQHRFIVVTAYPEE